MRIQVNLRILKKRKSIFVVLISSSTTVITFVTVSPFFCPNSSMYVYSMRKCAFFFFLVVLLKRPNEITTLLQKNIHPLLIWAYKCYPILNVGGVCVRVLMYSEPLGNKQSRTLKTQAGKAPNTLSF